MQGIPKEIRIPSQLVHRSRLPSHVTYIEGTLRDVALRFGMRIVEDKSLGFPTPLSFEFIQGAARAVIDYNELPMLPPMVGQYDRWYKLQTISAHVPFENVKPFSPRSFTDWERYRQLKTDIRYDGSGNSILYCQPTTIKVRGAEWVQDIACRRTLVKTILCERFGDLVDTKPGDQSSVWSRAGVCLASVHVPGVWNNALDVDQHQLMGFGVCTVSPVLHTQLPRTPLIPNVHYVACRDDYSDLPDRILWCQENRQACREIGLEARRAFIRNSTPEGIWSAGGEDLLKANSRIGYA